MAFRKPITTLGGLILWKNIRQSEYFIMQEHKAGLPLWPYKYRITLRENRMEIANSNDFQEIEMDWSYLQNNVVPQLSQKIDMGEVNLSGLISEIILKLVFPTR